MSNFIAGLIGYAEFFVPLAFCFYSFGPIILELMQ